MLVFEMLCGYPPFLGSTSAQAPNLATEITVRGSQQSMQMPREACLPCIPRIRHVRDVSSHS